MLSVNVYLSFFTHDVQNCNFHCFSIKTNNNQHYRHIYLQKLQSSIKTVHKLFKVKRPKFLKASATLSPDLLLVQNGRVEKDPWPRLPRMCHMTHNVVYFQLLTGRFGFFITFKRNKDISSLFTLQNTPQFLAALSSGISMLPFCHFFVKGEIFTVDFSLHWPRRLSSSLGNSEVCCEVVNYICQLANQIANFEMKLATSLPTKLVKSEVVLFFFFFF